MSRLWMATVAAIALGALAAGCGTTSAEVVPDRDERSPRVGLGLPDARALLVSGDVAGAIALSERYTQGHPKDPRGFYTLGTLQLQTGELNAARAAFEECLTLNPRHGVALNNLGLVELRAKHYDKAITAFQRAARLLPRDPEPLLNRGATEMIRGTYQYAVQAFEDALALAPKSLLGRLGLANALAHAGSRGDALGEYRLLAKDAKLMAKHAREVYVGMSTVLRQMGKYEAALAQAEAALTLAPTDPSARLAKALATDYKGDAGAEALYKEALASAPGHLELLYNYGAFLEEHHRKPEARGMYERYLAIDTDPASLRRRDVKILLERLSKP